MRAKFLLESVDDLRQNLEKKGSGLIVAYGHTEDVMAKLCKAIDDEVKVANSNAEQEQGAGIEPMVSVQEEPASEEYKVDKAVKRAVKTFKKDASGSLETVWAATLYDLEDVPYENGVFGMPDTFTPFRNKIEKVRVEQLEPNHSYCICQQLLQDVQSCRAQRLKTEKLIPTLSYSLHFQFTCTRTTIYNAELQNSISSSSPAKDKPCHAQEPGSHIRPQRRIPKCSFQLLTFLHANPCRPRILSRRNRNSKQSRRTWSHEIYRRRNRRPRAHTGIHIRQGFAQGIL